MRALRVHELTGPDAIWVDEIPIPSRRVRTQMPCGSR